MVIFVCSDRLALQPLPLLWRLCRRLMCPLLPLLSSLRYVVHVYKHMEMPRLMTLDVCVYYFFSFFIMWREYKKCVQCELFVCLKKKKEELWSHSIIHKKDIFVIYDD